MAASHCVVDAKKQVVRCQRCGEEAPLSLPDRALAFAERLNTFCNDHRDCLPRTAAEMAEELRYHAGAAQARSQYQFSKLLAAAADMLKEVGDG